MNCKESSNEDSKRWFSMQDIVSGKVISRTLLQSEVMQLMKGINAVRINNPGAIDYLIHYIYDSQYDIGWNAYMVMSVRPESIINSFKLVQNFYNKTDKKRVQHIIIGFHDRDGETANGLFFIAEEAARFISRRFQCCYGIHHSSDHHSGYRHIHLAINPVSWVDGKRFYETYQNLYELQEHLDTVTDGKFCWSVRMKASELYVPDYQSGGLMNTPEDMRILNRL